MRDKSKGAQRPKPPGGSRKTQRSPAPAAAKPLPPGPPLASPPQQRRPPGGDLPKAPPLLPPGAPLEAQAMAMLLRWDQAERARERPLDLFVHVLDRASLFRNPLTLIPEMKTLAELRRALPASLQGVDAPLPQAVLGNEGPLIEYPYQAMTPVLRSTVAFAKALEIADHPGEWTRSTPQMERVNDQVLLPANGALWRWSLTKRTDFGKPLLNGLVAEETIHITAEGSTSADGLRGHRRYTHVLAASATDANLLRVVKDTGWIELSGDEQGIQLRIQKQATILRPPNDPYAAILSAAFTAELWLWALGFFEAAGAQSGPQLKVPLKPLPANTKPPVPAPANPYRIAVLGGGPAGLACAWLLSNPVSPQGAPAWTLPAGANFKLDVKLLEKSCILGGKAASGRRRDNQKHRVEEHGLHVLMGCYTNVLRMMEWSGLQAKLTEFGKTHLPRVGAQGLDDMWTVDLGPWAKEANVVPLADWLQGVPAEDWQDWQEFLQVPEVHLERTQLVATRFSQAAIAPRPLLRAFAQVGQRFVDQRPVPSALPRTTQDLHLLVSHFLTVRLMKAEIGKTAFLMQSAQGPDPGNVAAMASLLRAFARTALPADSTDQSVLMLREWVELATTIVVGLEEEEMFPYWALDDPSKLLEVEYRTWVQLMQTLDNRSLREWLEQHGIAAGFVPASRVLAALTASVFTTPDGIAAGTFLHGMARLLLTYEGLPYRRMQGGTGDAFIAPIYQYLKSLAPDLSILAGTAVEELVWDGGSIKSVLAREVLKCVEADFSAGGPEPEGWRVPSAATPADTLLAPIEADAFVLAIPPYGSTVAGIPAALQASLDRIESRATIGVQCWTDGAPRFPDAIVSSLPGPLRCAAAMSELGEGADFGIPVYACGDVDDGVALQWSAGDQPLEAWLDTYQAMLQQGTIVNHPPFKKVNHEGSERYTCANVATQEGRRLVYDTGVPNLWIAGDWTRTALSCGSIEAAVTSGLEAACDILEKLGCTVDFPIVGSLSKEPKA